MGKKSNAKLREEASALLEGQMRVLEQAGKVVGIASKQFSDYSKEYVVPKIHAGADATKDVILNKVLPAVAGAASASSKVFESLKDRVVPAPPPPKKSGFAKFLLVGIGVAAVAAAALAAWNILAEPDEPWVDEFDD